MSTSAAWIQTFSGMHFELLEPEKTSIWINDIAHSLSRLCRFTGHVRTFYSVAQHCVLVSEQVPPRYAMAGLLHDASEAYIGDISSPVKRLFKPRVDEIEGKILSTIYERFSVPYKDIPLEVKTVDKKMLATEAHQLLPGGILSSWHLSEAPYGEETKDGFNIMKITPWDREEAYHQFLSRFDYLERGIG